LVVSFGTLAASATDSPWINSVTSPAVAIATPSSTPALPVIARVLLLSQALKQRVAQSEHNNVAATAARCHGVRDRMTLNHFSS
jgi:hypothetical protein